MSRSQRRWTRLAGGLALVVLAAGCVTRADLLDQEKRYRTLVIQQNRSLDQVKREVERLRADSDEGRPRSRVAAEQSPEQRITDLEGQVHRLESNSQEIGMTPDPSSTIPTLPPGSPISPPPVLGEAPPAAAPPTTMPEQLAAAAPPPTTPPPPPTPIDEEWRREVAQDQAVAGTIDVPERAEYLNALQG